MKLKYEIVIQEVGDTFIAVTVGKKAEQDSVETFINLNDTGVAIVERLREETTRDEVIESLLKEYDAPREFIAESVDSLLQTISPLIEE